MKRKQQEPTPIQPTACYDRADLSRLLGVQGRAITEAVHRGDLHPEKRLGLRRVFLGSWVLAWLETPDRRPVPVEAVDAQAG